MNKKRSYRLWNDTTIWKIERGDFVLNEEKKIKNKIIKYVKVLYSIISVISTLTVFSALLIYLLGCSNLGKVCDDDLIMERIQNQIPSNLSISDIRMEDIHGFGNQSIIVLAFDDEDYNIANQILIFDKIDNNILNQSNNIFGFGSNYKLSYMFSIEGLDDEGIYGYTLGILDLVDLTGDFSKELIVEFMSVPPGSGLYNMIGIFSYSYEKHTYYLLGTYPPSSQFYDGDKPSDLVSTVFKKDDLNYRNAYDKKETFNLEYSSKYERDFFMETSHFGTVLVRTYKTFEDLGDPDLYQFIVNVFQPVYDPSEDDLKWDVINSEKVNDKIEFFSEEKIKNYLKDKHDIY